MINTYKVKSISKDIITRSTDCAHFFFYILVDKYAYHIVVYDSIPHSWAQNPAFELKALKFIQ